MIQLLANAYTAIRWTAASQPIAGVAWASLIVKVYARNRVTGSGYINYIPSNQFPSLTTFEVGIDYLVYASSTFDVADAVASPSGAFAAFAGYTPPTGSTTPPIATGSIPGTVNAQIAAVQIIGGTLVARVAEGLVPYTASNLDMRYLLFGFALNSAAPGGTVQVQRNGYVTYPGLGLIPGATLFAGDNGRMAYSHDGMALHHVIGRAESDDSFSFTSSYTTVKLTN